MPDKDPTNQTDKPAVPAQSAPTESNTKSSLPEKQETEPGLLARLQQRFGTLGLLLVGLVLAVLGFFYFSSRSSSADDSNASSQVIIVQLNDIYRLDAVRAGKRGGLARVVSLLRQLKAQNPQVPVIVVHAGDFLSPSLESNVFHGMQMIDAMNFIHDIAPLYVVPGNHEFDYKDNETAYLTEALQKSRFPWIAANLERNNASLLPALQNTVVDHRLLTFGKLKLGIFGLTLDGAQSGNTDRSYAPISGEYARIAGAQIQQLESQGADLIVGLTHLNMSDDRELAKLKQQHPRFRWIAGGHEHALDWNAAWSGGALITKGDSNARTVWKVSVTKNGPNLDLREESIVVDESIPHDPVFTQNIENFYRTKLRNERPYLDTVISTQPARCYDGTEEAVRDRESDWGDFLTDTMRTTYKGITADVAVLNGGSIRLDDTICDRITFENLERTFAYETPIVFVKLKGHDLRTLILENSIGSKQGDGRFLQVSGVSFRRELSADKEKKVIKDLQVQSANRQVAFDDNKTYIVAMNEFIFNCGDNYRFRQFVTDYIPAGPDLRAVTYAARSAQAKNNGQAAGRIIDLPAYVKLYAGPTPKWQTLNASDHPCPVR